MSIIPLPSAGMPTSGQPWKWKCLITLVCFSFGGKNGQEDEIMSLKRQREERVCNLRASGRCCGPNLMEYSRQEASNQSSYSISCPVDSRCS